MENSASKEDILNSAYDVLIEGFDWVLTLGTTMRIFESQEDMDGNISDKLASVAASMLEVQLAILKELSTETTVTPTTIIKEDKGEI